MPTNKAAFLMAKQAPNLEVHESPYVEPQENQILVRTTAVAVNPVDWKIQDYGMFFEKFPNILGCDTAGTVVSTGPGVSGFSKGDRIMGHNRSLETGNQAEAAFQEYVILQLPLVCKIPDNIKDEEAVVLPLCLDTAASGLFESVGLGLTLPPSSAGKGKAVFIWGGSSSVGMNAVQLAAASQYEVFTTASSHNHQLLKDLGAKEVFDYKDSNLVEDIVAALKGKEVVGGMDTISEEKTIKASCEILSKAGGVKKLELVLPGSDEHVTGGVTGHCVFGVSPAHNEVGPHLWKWLPKALQDGSYKAKPDPISAGKGLESIQGGLKMNKDGVSGKKVVITF